LSDDDCVDIRRLYLVKIIQSYLIKIWKDF